MEHRDVREAASAAIGKLTGARRGETHALSTAEIRTILLWCTSKRHSILDEVQGEEGSKNEALAKLEQLRECAADELARCLAPPENPWYKRWFTRGTKQLPIEDARLICSGATSVPDFVTCTLLEHGTRQDFVLLVRAKAKEDAAALRLLESGPPYTHEEIRALLKVKATAAAALEIVLTLSYDYDLYMHALKITQFKDKGMEDLRSRIGLVILEQDLSQDTIFSIIKLCKGEAHDRGIEAMIQKDPTLDELTELLGLTVAHPQRPTLLEMLVDRAAVDTIQHLRTFRTEDRAERVLGPRSARHYLVMALGTQLAKQARDLLLASHPSCDELYAIYRSMACDDPRRELITEALFEALRKEAHDDGFFIVQLIRNVPEIAQRVARFTLDHWDTNHLPEEWHQSVLCAISEQSPILRERAESLMSASLRNIMGRISADVDLGET